MRYLHLQKCNIFHTLGHFSKVCQRRQHGAAQGPTQRGFIPKQKPSRFGGKQVHEIENDNLYIVDSAGNQIGITDYDSVTQAFQELNYAVIDLIEFSLDPGTGKLKYNCKHSNVEINQVLRAKTWKEAETTIVMYPSDDKGKVTGRPKGMRSRLDTDAGANIMSLSTYKSINPSDVDKDGNPIGNFQRASTGLKSFRGRQIQQYGIKTIKCVWDKKLWLLNFHIVDAEGPILIGLGTMLKLDMIQFHPQVHISCIDINTIQPSLARQGKIDAEIDVMSKTNHNDSVSE